MKLIITIPKGKYCHIQELEQGNTDYATTRMLYHAVKHGKPYLEHEEKEMNETHRICSGINCPYQRTEPPEKCRALAECSYFTQKVDYPLFMETYANHIADLVVKKIGIIDRHIGKENEC